MQSYKRECMMHLYVMRQCADLAMDFDEKFGNELTEKFQKAAQGYEALGGSYE